MTPQRKSDGDPLEVAYQRGRESGIADERERAARAGVLRNGEYVEVEPPLRSHASFLAEGCRCAKGFCAVHDR